MGYSARPYPRTLLGVRSLYGAAPDSVLNKVHGLASNQRVNAASSISARRTTPAMTKALRGGFRVARLILHSPMVVTRFRQGLRERVRPGAAAGNCNFGLPDASQSERGNEVALRKPPQPAGRGAAKSKLYRIRPSSDISSVALSSPSFLQISKRS